MVGIALDTCHGVCFARACLTVGENCAIIAFEHVLDNRAGSVVVNLPLACSVVIANVKSELFWRFVTSKRFRYKDFTSVWFDCDDALVAVFLLLARQGSDSDTDLDCFIFLRQLKRWLSFLHNLNIDLIRQILTSEAHISTSLRGLLLLCRLRSLSTLGPI